MSETQAGPWIVWSDYESALREPTQVEALLRRADETARTLTAQCAWLRRRLLGLREALEDYANEDNWRSTDMAPDELCVWADDHGHDGPKRALDALAVDDRMGRFP